MRIKLSVWCVLLLLAFGVKGQVSITLQVPPVGVVQKNQLWNMVLVNGSTAPFNAEVAITLLNAADNIPVMTATGRTVALTKGARQLKYADFSPVNYKYLSAVFNGDLRPEGFLPAGNYTACYTVSRWITDYTEVVAEECINLEIQPLSPPVLNTPPDGEVLDIRAPQFTWLPPSPIQLMGDLNYDIVVTKIGTGQSAISAVQQNIPVYNTGRYRKNFLNYPASATLLDTGVNYAWCVVARNGSQVIAQSDVWTFSVKGYQPTATEREGASFIRLQRELNTAEATCIGDVRLAYQNDAADSLVRFTIQALEDVQHHQLIEGTLPVTAGLNLLATDAAVKKQLENGKRYLFQLYNSRNESWQTKFLYFKQAQ